MPEVFFGQARPFLAGILPYGKENERSLPEKAPGRPCSMAVNTGPKSHTKILLVPFFLDFSGFFELLPTGCPIP